MRIVVIIVAFMVCRAVKPEFMSVLSSDEKLELWVVGAVLGAYCVVLDIVDACRGRKE